MTDLVQPVAGLFAELFGQLGLADLCELLHALEMHFFGQEDAQLSTEILSKGSLSAIKP